VQALDGSAELPAGVAFSADEIEVLDAIDKSLMGKTKLQSNPHHKRTLAWAAWIIARLGGWTGYARLPTSDLRVAMDKSPTMRATTFLKYVQVLVVKTAHTAIANSVGRLHQRLARWLLMAHDRVEKDTLLLTHEFLSIMLAVRRPGVTEATTCWKRKT
jgi:hypothetical protein